jgi:hypothetical protein
MDKRLKQLRRSFDGDDTFMVGGHQIVKDREFHRDIPDWMLNRVALAAFLSSRFPLVNNECPYGVPPDKCHYCDCRTCRHRRNAGLWTFTINVCFLLNETATDAAVYWNEKHEEDLHIEATEIRRITQMILLAAAGKRLDGKPRSFGKAGRPKKSTCTVETSFTDHRKTRSSAAPTAT